MDPRQAIRPATEIVELPRPECLSRLAATAFGRIVVSVTGWDHAVIRPVNYVFDESSQCVALPSARGSKLHALLRSAKAAFEIDGIDPTEHVGWSVIIVGVCEEVTDPGELRRIDALGLDPWAPGHKGHWIRIRSNTVSGREIVIAAPLFPPTTHEQQTPADRMVPGLHKPRGFVAMILLCDDVPWMPARGSAMGELLGEQSATSRLFNHPAVTQRGRCRAATDPPCATATPLRAETAAHAQRPREAPDRWNVLATFRGSAELRRRT
jgi:uncharacterized protein